MTAEILAFRKKQPQWEPEIPAWLVQYAGLARQIADGDDTFMPSVAEFDAVCSLERAGIVEETGFFGGGWIGYGITDRGRRWLAGIPREQSDG